MLLISSRVVLAAALAGAVGMVPARLLAQAAQGSQPKPDGAAKEERQWKDRAEYDLYNSILTGTDANAQLQKLNEWKEKYPTTQFDKERRTLYLNTYVKLNQAPNAINSAKDLLTLDANDFTSLYYIALLSPQLPNPGPDVIDQEQKAANTLLNGALDKQFVPANKPATTSEADWKQARTQVEIVAHNTLASAATQQKNYEEAEKQYRAILAINPNDGQTAYWLGTAVLSQKKPEKQCEGLYYIARSVAYDGQGALPANSRQQIDTTYLQRAYKQFHGSNEGLDQLKTQAKTNPTPSGCAIKSAKELADADAAKAAEEAAKNPAMALWKSIKASLTAADGANYFDTGMKGALLPGGANGVKEFSGKVVKLEPETNPKTVILAIEDGTTPDATLKFDTALPGKVEPGTQLSFQGVPESYSANPFTVVFKVEKDHLSGWTGKAAPAVHRRPAPARRR